MSKIEMHCDYVKIKEKRNCLCTYTLPVSIKKVKSVNLLNYLINVLSLNNQTITQLKKSKLKDKL